MNDVQARICKLADLESRLDFLFPADEKEFGDFRIGLQRELDPIDNDLASVVATHDIDSDSHK